MAHEWTIERLNNLAKTAMSQEKLPLEWMRELGIAPETLHELSILSFDALLDMASVPDAIAALGSAMFGLGMLVQQELDNAAEN